MVALVVTAAVFLLMAIALGVQHVLDGRNFLLDAWERFQLGRKTLAAWDAYRLTNLKQTDVIISLTTIPERIDKISGTLKSLLAQAIAPRAIHLYVPRISRRSGAPYEIPTNLHALKSIRIIRCDDHGPATKFIDVLKTSAPKQRILVVDDDKLYPQQFVAAIDSASAVNPDIALGYSGWRVPDDLTDRPTTLWANIFKRPPAPVKATRVRKLYQVDVLQGYSGYVIRPAFFDLHALADYSNSPSAAFFVDDVWMSAQCRVQKYVFPARRFCFENRRYLSDYSKSSLGNINRGDGQNSNRNNTIMIRFFGDKWQSASSRRD